VFWGVTLCRDEWSAVGNHFAGDAVWLLEACNVSTASDSLPATQKLRSREAGIATARENVAGISVNMCQGRIGDSAVTKAATVRSQHLISCLSGWGSKKKDVLLSCPKTSNEICGSYCGHCGYVILGFICGVRSPLFWDVTQSRLAVSY